MTTNGEQEIPFLLEERARATAAKDVEGSLRPFANDVVTFDLALPLVQRGAAATGLKP